jgi:hypothetical protein
VAVCLKPLYCFLFNIYTGRGWLHGKERAIGVQLMKWNLDVLTSSCCFCFLLVWWFLHVKSEYTSRENCVGKCPQPRHSACEECHCSHCSVIMFHYRIFYKTVTACTSGFPIIISYPNKKKPVLSSVVIWILFAYLLTYSMEQSPSWEANGSWLVNKFPAFYRTWRFITTLTRS